MRKKLTIFGLSLALVLGMILLSVGQQPMILPGFNLTDLVDVNAATPSDGYVITWDSATGKWIPAVAGVGAGDVTGPVASTDNAIATFHLATGKIIQQNHSVLIDDSSNIGTPGAVSVNTGLATGEIGLNLYSITPTYSIIAQSDAEGIASSSDTRLGLDPTLNTFIICQRDDIATDFAKTAQADPTLYIINTAGTSSFKLRHNLLSAQGLMQFATETGPIIFRLYANYVVGNLYEFDSNAGCELTDTDAEQAWMYLEPKINQTSTAGYIGLLMDVTESSTGSGTNALMDLRLGSASKFKVDNSGYINSGTYSGALADNDTFTTPIPDTWTGIVIVQNTTDTTSGVYHLDGTAITAINQNAAFTVTQGTNDKVNVYVAGNVLTVENTWAAAKTVRVMFVGT